MIGSNMFAYCYNEPVSNRDITGKSPFSTLTLADYQNIHRIVQWLCVAEYGWRFEVYVKSGNKRGFLDLYDSKTGAYYEVKSYGSRKSWRTKSQMKKYDSAQIRDDRFKGTSTYNSTIHKGRCPVRGKFAYGVYDVTYYLYADGLIVYETKRNWGRTAAVAVGLTVILLAATGNVGAAAGLGGLIPGLT